MALPTLALALTVKDGWRKVRAVVLVLMLGAIAVSLNRNMYAGVTVGILLAALLGGSLLRTRLALVVGGVAVVLVLVIVTAVVPAFTSDVGKRAATLTTPGTVLASGSISDRAYELSYALPEIGRHPWFGIGPLQHYGALLATSGQGIGQRVQVQDLYADIALDYGIPAALAFLLVPGVALWSAGRRVLRTGDAPERAMLSACIGGLVALMLSLLVGTYVQTPDSTLAFAVGCGLLLAACARAREASPPRPAR